MAILFAILLFSFLIFIHELGHFVAAKLSGVQVNEFSMFMGPAIFKKQVGETLYAIRCIPIGGYCAMEGEDADTDNPRSFQKAAWWKRLIILVAGSAMNFIAGLLILAIVFFPAEQLTEPVVGEFMDCCIFNNENSLQLGDRLLEIDGEKIYITNDVSMLLNLNTTGVHDLVVERDGSKVVLNDLPMTHTHLDENGEEYRHYGFSFGKAVEATFGGTVKYIWNTAMDYVRMVRLSLGMLLSGQAGIQDLGGPVMIVQQMAQTAEASSNAFYAFLNMMNFGALIAVNLAVMNLLPIPALDGGRAVALLLTTAIEAVTKKKINPKYEAFIHGAGMILLLILMAVIFLKDIFVIFKG